LPDARRGMTGKPDFHEEMDRFQGHMPEWADRHLTRLRHPRAVWVRVPAGIALTGGGVFSVLPGLGIWMLPVGLALLAHDVPVMRRPLARVLNFTNDKIEQRKERRKTAAAAKQAKQAKRKPPAKPAAEPAPKLAAKSTAKAAPKPAPKRAAKPAPKPSTKTALKPAPETVASAAPKTPPKPAVKRSPIA
jgi:hypothetical protein